MMEKILQKGNHSVALERNRLINCVESAINLAKKGGATQAEVGASIDMGLTAAVRMGDVDKLEFNRSHSIGITVYQDGKKGNAGTSDLSEAAIKQAVARALDIASVIEADPCAGLAAAEKMATQYKDCDCFYPWDLEAKQAIALAKECEAYGLNYDAKITNSEGAEVNNYQSHYVYANSHGFVGDYGRTRHNLSCVLVASDGNSMQRDYDYTTARDANDLNDPQAVAKSAAERTLSRLGGRSLSTRTVPVIFHADMARGLFSNFFSAISGGSLYRQSSFLCDSLGQDLFPSWIQISEHPHLAKGLGSRPFDNDGIATYEKSFIQDGRLQSYVLSEYSARRLKLETTGNAGGIFNARINHNDLSFEALLKQMDTGLLVTELMGQGSNLVTGDYSRGAAGFWVEGGEIQYPVEEITIASNLRDMFLNIENISSDVDKRGNIHTGSMLLKHMVIAG